MCLIWLNLLSLFKSWLSNGSQCLQIDWQKLTSSNITWGVPQGSIFASLIFILYISDFNSCTKDFNFINFADDSTLYAKGKSLSDLRVKIKTKLHKVLKWFQINRLSVNASKSFFIVFSSVSRAKLPALSINGINLDHSTTIKFLRSLVDIKVNFAPHIRDVCIKVSRGIVVCR